MACFAGFRLLRWVLAAFGFIIGGLAASSILGTGDTAYMAGAFLLGGLAGAVIMVAASFVGVALVGAGLGALAVTLIWTQVDGDPHPYVVVLAAVAGAWLATWLQRYVTIVGTAFGGAWAMLVGVLAITGDQRQAGRRGRRRRVGAVSDAAGARAGVGAVGVARARRRRRAGAALRHRRRGRPGASEGPQEERAERSAGYSGLAGRRLITRPRLPL